MRGSFLTYISGLILLLAAGSCSDEPEYISISGGVWHTASHITYLPEKDTPPEKAIRDSVRNVLQEVDATLSMFNSASEIYRINRLDTAGPCSPMLRGIFLESARITKLSKGAFDPTVAPLTQLWGFGIKDSSDNAGKDSVTQKEVDSVMEYVGITDCRLDPDGRIVKKHHLTSFDFSAIAKGYAVDRIAEMLARNGVSNFLVEIGGEVAAHGVNPDGETWKVGIEDPLDDSGKVGKSFVAAVGLENLCIATSGSYRNIRTVNGKTVSHILNPATGKPVDTPTLSATVIAPLCVTADALATACMVLPADSAISLLTRLPDTEGLIITAGENPSGLRLLPTPSFNTLLGN